MLGGVSTLMVTSSVVDGHVDPATVHRKTLAPVDKPETDDVALLALTKVPDPLTTDQIPPLAGVAAKVTEEEQTVWSLPAKAVAGDV